MKLNLPPHKRAYAMNLLFTTIAVLVIGIIVFTRTGDWFWLLPGAISTISFPLYVYGESESPQV